ncbi:MAG TPA: alkaline phosphatase family protein [Actinospica sp.]|nr:alkaline phosphatase family protein [Actinospica sp.]
MAASAASSSLSAVKHVLILMQENRSFDHYYGRRFAGRLYAQ